MKRVFVEPQIKRIELNMKENIASSVEQNMGYYFTYTLFTCTIVSTGKMVGAVTHEAAEVCIITPKAKIGGGTIVPENEVRPHFRR